MIGGRGVFVAVGVLVAVEVEVAVGVGVRVSVGDGVEVAFGVTVNVAVGIDVEVRVGVGDASNAAVGMTATDVAAGAGPQAASTRIASQTTEPFVRSVDLTTPQLLVIMDGLLCTVGTPRRQVSLSSPAG